MSTAREICLAQTETVGHVEENVDRVVHAAEFLLARTHGEHGDVGQRVHALGLVDGERAGVQEAGWRIFVVSIIILRSFLQLDSRQTGSVLVDNVVLVVVGAGTETVVQSVTGIPLGGEVHALRVDERGVGLDGVLRQARLFVGANGVALLAIVFLGLKILGVDGAHDVEAVPVVSSDNNQSVVQLPDGTQLLDGSFNGVVELEELAKGAVVVHGVHLLVDVSSLSHEEEAVVMVLRAGVENVNGLESHVLQTGLVIRILGGPVGVVLLALEVVRVDVAVEPGGHVAGGEESKGSGVIRGLRKGGVVPADAVSALRKKVVVGLVLVRLLGEEVLSTTAKEHVGSVELGPGVVLQAVVVAVDNMSIRAAISGVGNEASGRSVGCNTT